MNTSLSKHPSIKPILRSFKRFCEGNLDIVGLQQNVSALASSIEGDVPKTVRNELYHLEAQIENIRFTVDKELQNDEIEKLLSQFEQLITNYD